VTPLFQPERLIGFRAKREEENLTAEREEYGGGFRHGATAPVPVGDAAAGRCQRTERHRGRSLQPNVLLRAAPTYGDRDLAADVCDSSLPQGDRSQSPFRRGDWLRRAVMPAVESFEATLGTVLEPLRAFADALARSRHAPS